MNCLPGFTIDNFGSCNICSPGCDSCQLPDLKCQYIDGYYNLGNENLRCNDSCLTCQNSASQCITCNLGFFVLNGTCTPCIQNCLTCSSDTNALCYSCKMGYSYSKTNKACVKCISGCAYCHQQKVFDCLNCGVGFQSFSSTVTSTNTSITICVNCPTNCMTCHNGTCNLCNSGFRLTNNNTCIPSCELPCKQCSQNDTTSCTSCLGGYILSGTQCLPDLTCNLTQTCIGCPRGYTLALNQCFKCEGGDNCVQCEITNYEKCSICAKGYYLTSAKLCINCSAIVEGCYQCESDIYCKRCQPGYFLAGYPSGKCKRCDNSCHTCIDTPQTCTSCPQNKIKIGWSCFNNQSIQLTLKLLTDYNNFTTTNLSSIQQSLCSIVTKTSNDIVIESILSGSVIIKCKINIDNADQQTIVVNKLNSSLSTGSLIAGFPVQSVAVNINDNNNNPVICQNCNPQTNSTINQPHSSSNNKLIIIICSTVIPISVIIIFLILFYLYKKGKIGRKQPQKQPQKVIDASMNQMNIHHKDSQPHTIINRVEY